MLNLLWSVLNAAVMLGLFYVFFRAAKLVKQHINTGTALFFVFGLFAIGGSKSNSNAAPTANRNLLANAPQNAPLGNASALQTIYLGGSYDLKLLAEYNVNNHVITPRGLFITASGFVLGHAWEPLRGTLGQQGQPLHYEVAVHHQWLLLGMRVFSKLEQFEGTMTLTKL